MKLRTIALVALTLAGCGWKSDGRARLEQEYPTPPPPDAGMSGPIDIGTPMCSGYQGNWAVQVVQVGTIAPVAEVWTLTIHDLFLADSDGQTMNLRFCDEAAPIVTPEGPTTLGETKIPDSLKTALHDAPVVLALPTDGSFQAHDVVWLWGVHNLSQPLTDALPDAGNWQSDPHVFDQDGDGQPGITMDVLVPMGERYMARRSIWQLAPGKLTLDNQWVTGVVTATVEQSVLGASIDLLTAPTPITPKPSGSVYQLRCVGQTYTCAALSNDYVTLFGDAPQ